MLLLALLMLLAPYWDARACCACIYYDMILEVEGSS